MVRHRTASLPFSRILTGLLICCALAACGKISPVSPPGPSLPVIQQARDAWKARNMPLAEKLYKSIAGIKGITPAEYREAFSRYAVATAKNNRPDKALNILRSWNNTDPSAKKLAEWQDAWFLCTRELSPSHVVANAQKMWLTQGVPEGLQARAAFILMGRSFSASQTVRIAPGLSILYEKSSRERRAVMEQFLLMETPYIKSPTLDALLGNIPSGRRTAFPYSLFLLEHARRIAGNQPEQAKAILSELRGSFADPGLPESALSQGRDKRTCIVLALPASGVIAPISNRIITGAGIAQQELVAGEHAIQLEIINTETQDWLSRLSALPPQCVVVGGPLQSGTFQQISTNGDLEQRAVFGFLPQLEAGEEGGKAWRFFPGNSDQIAALLSFTRGTLGLQNFAAFYPEDQYGKRMTDILESSLAAQGIRLNRQSYEPQASITWPDSAAPLLQDSGGQPRHIDAIFLPDSWKNMDALTKSFLYYGDNTMVMMGTSLWEQGISGKFVAQAEKYTLSVFPAAWNPDNVPASLSASGKTDFWKCLGYDFVRFAAAMDLQEMPTDRRLITDRANAAGQSITWSLAPIQWDGLGHAHQSLYLFTPTSRGMAPLNPETFRQLRTARLEEAAGKISDSEPGTANAATPPAPQKLPLTPRPSHKLQLPGTY